MSYGGRRASYCFLCLVPILAGALTSIRSLRVSPVYQTIGMVHFALVVMTMWSLSAKAIVGGASDRRRVTIAGTLLVMPFTLVALLWVGLSTPWESNAEENRLRYAVLLFSSIAVTGGFVVLWDLLAEAEERFYSTLGFAAALLAGAAYVAWTSFQLGAYVMKVQKGELAPGVAAVANVLDILLFIAGVLTFLSTAGFAASLGRVGWLRRGASRTFVVINIVATLFLVTRGLSFPDPASGSTPWYTRPGFIMGIPAVPWIIPHLVGAALLRRAGDRTSTA